MGNHEDQRFTETDAEIIRRKASKLMGRSGFRRSDQPDLQQELAMHVSIRMDCFDPTRGTRETFVNKVANRKAINMIQHAIAEKRDRRKERQLDEPQASRLADSGQALNRRDVALDVTEAISRLPDDLRAIATLFITHTEAEAIRKTGFSRQRVRGMRQRIADHFRLLGLDPESCD